MKYGLVRVRIILGEGPMGARVLMYNTRLGRWIDLTANEKALDYIMKYKSATVGLTRNGFHTTIAIPANKIPAWLEEYIIDYTTEIPERPVIMDEVEVIIRNGKKGA